MSLDLTKAVETAVTSVHYRDIRPEPNRSLLATVAERAVQVAAPEVLRATFEWLENWLRPQCEGSPWDWGADAVLTRLRELADELEAGRE